MKKELVPITHSELEKYGWETEDSIAYVLMLDETRHIDVFKYPDSWVFQLTQEPTFKGEDVAIFQGREVKYMSELLEVYSVIMGFELSVQEQ